MRENWPHADSRSCGMGGPIHLLARWHKRRPEPDFSFILVLRMFVVFINRCLGFCVVVTFVLLVPANRLVRKTVFFAPVKWLARKIVSKMTYYVSSGTLNTTVLYHTKENCSFGRNSIQILLQLVLYHFMLLNANKFRCGISCLLMMWNWQF